MHVAATLLEYIKIENDLISLAEKILNVLTVKKHVKKDKIIKCVEHIERWRDKVLVGLTSPVDAINSILLRAAKEYAKTSETHISFFRGFRAFDTISSLRQGLWPILKEYCDVDEKSLGRMKSFDHRKEFMINYYENKCNQLSNDNLINLARQQ